MRGAVMGVTDCSALKHAMRSRFLRKLRDQARSDPVAHQQSSIAVSNILFDYIKIKHLMGMGSGHHSKAQRNEEANRASVVSSNLTILPAKRKQLYICATLPLYYEVNLLPLLEKVWHWRQANRLCHKASSASNINVVPTEVYTMVPIVLEPLAMLQRLRTPSQKSIATCYHEWHHPIMDVHNRLSRAMAFVELCDAKDLSECFETHDPFKLWELRYAEFESLFVKRKPVNQQKEGQLSRYDSDRKLPFTAGSRRILLCEDWESLFPEHLSPPGLLHLWSGQNSCQNVCTNVQTKQHVPYDFAIASSQSESNRHCIDISGSCDVEILVLVPGVCFQRLGGLRVGKGGGFYDRFLNYLRRVTENGKVVSLPYADISQIAGGYGAKDNIQLAVESIGVAFDEQLLNTEANFKSCDSLWACVNKQDACVDSIVTPCLGVQPVMGDD